MTMYKEPCTININEESGYRSLAYVEGPVNIIGDPNGNIIEGVQWYTPPIITAAVNGHDNHEVVKTLIEMGADVNATDCIGSTALHHAAFSHRLKILELLLEYGANVHHANQDGDTALHSAAISWDTWCGSSGYENDLLVIKALLRNKSEVNARNKQGKTPLMLAIRGFHLDIVKELLEAGADVNVRSTSGETCLQKLFDINGRTDIMIELIKAGASLQVVDELGNTPLRSLFRTNPMDDTPIEDFKALIKCALLVENEQKEHYYGNEEVNNFVDECYAEVQKMRTFQFGGKLSFCDFALRGGGKSKRIVNAVYRVMIKSTFKIYDDYIAAHFERKYLCEKALEKRIYTTMDHYDIVLPEDLVNDICKFLSKMDLLNLLRVFANCLPPRLKRKKKTPQRQNYLQV